MPMKTVRWACLVASAGVVSLGAAGGNGIRIVDAVKQGNPAAVKALIAQHADVNAAEADGMTALHWAVRANDLQTVQMLIRAGAKVEVASRYGMTPILLAAQNGDPAVVAALLKVGANPNSALPEGETALMTAARTGNVDTVKLLVETGAKIDAKENWQGQTALMWAAAQNNAAAVKTLIELGADKNERSKLLSFPEFKFETSGMVVTVLPRGGWTPLMYAARQDARDAMRALVKAGAGGFMSAILPTGKRAVAIKIDNGGDSSAGGFILPNDRVDVVRLARDEEATKARGIEVMAAQPILSNVRVLAIGQNVEEQNGKKVITGANATLELDPDQVNLIILAKHAANANLHLVLRSLVDSGGPAQTVVSADGGLTVVRYGAAQAATR